MLMLPTLSLSLSLSLALQHDRDAAAALAIQKYWHRYRIRRRRHFDMLKRRREGKAGRKARRMKAVLDVQRSLASSRHEEHSEHWAAFLTCPVGGEQDRSKKEIWRHRGSPQGPALSIRRG